MVRFTHTPGLTQLLSRLVFASLSHPPFSNAPHKAVMPGNVVCLGGARYNHVYPLDDVALCGPIGD